MPESTDVDLARLRALRENTTPGVWDLEWVEDGDEDGATGYHYPSDTVLVDDMDIINTRHSRDAEFIVAIHAATPALFDELDAQATQIVNLTAVLTGAVKHTYAGLCPDDLEGWEARDPQCPACVLLPEPTAVSV